MDPSLRRVWPASSPYVGEGENRAWYCMCPNILGFSDISLQSSKKEMEYIVSFEEHRKALKAEQKEALASQMR